MKALFAKLLTCLPNIIAQQVTLDSHTRIGRWYHTNGIFKFAVGTPIALNDIRAFGYGIRPVGVVKGYTAQGKYVIQMEKDVDGNFFDWINGCYTPSGNRSRKEEVHFKWNVEYHFRAISRPDAMLAYA